MASGVSAGGALAAGPLMTMVDKFANGKLIIPPGVAFFAYISNAALALTAVVTVIGVEEPITPGSNV